MAKSYMVGGTRLGVEWTGTGEGDVQVVAISATFAIVHAVHDVFISILNGGSRKDRRKDVYTLSLSPPAPWLQMGERTLRILDERRVV